MQDLHEMLPLETFSKIQDSFDSLWNSSKYFKIATISCGTISGYLLTRYTYYKVKQRLYKTPPGPIGAPLIGESTKLMDREFLKEIATCYGDIVTCFIGPSNLVLLNEPKLAKKYYSDPRSLYNALPETDVTFFSTNGKTWAERRRIIFANLMSTLNNSSYVETVTKKFIKTKLFPIFDEHIKDNQTINLKPLFRPIGFNIVLQACFGKELKSLDDPFWLKWDERLQEHQKSAELRFLLWNMLGNSSFTWWIQKTLTGDDFKSFKRINEEIDVLEELANNKKHDIVLDEEMKENENIKLFNDYVESYINNEDGAKYTRRHLLGDMALMFGAATDTTFAAFCFCMRLAGKYPNIQQELHQEIVAAFGNDVDNIELRNKGITKLPKLRAFLHESLRIYPPAPTAGIRQLRADGMNFEGHYIPKGTVTSINVVAISCNPKYWIKDYDEERDGNINMEEVHLDFWMDDEGKFSKKKNSANFFTFHYGKRDCAGQSLAMKEMLIVLAMIFMKYEVKTFEGTSNIDIKAIFGGAVMEPPVKDVRLIHRH